jgi:hypothetical protein
MSHTYLRIITLLPAVALAAVLQARAEDQSPTKPAEDAKPAAAKPKPPFTISKETTYIVAPLDADGYPDYVAAINRHCRIGVTPENNAAVLFWQAVGPDEIRADHRAEFFKQLGIDPLPEKGDYFVTLEQFAKQLADAGKAAGQKADESIGKAFLDAPAKAAQGPWSKKDFPQVAAWLDANEKPLALLIEASKRPRRFDPVVAGKSYRLLFTLMPLFTSYREAGRALAARAMLRLGDGRVDEAWQDLLACHRLARLVAEGPSVDDRLVGGTLDNMAFSAERGMLQQQHLSAEQAFKMRDDLDRLPAMPHVADKIDVGERCIYLDNVGYMAGDAVHQLSEFAKFAYLGPGSPEQEAYAKSVFDAAAAGPIEWDVVLRLGNTRCDRIVDSMRKSTRAERKAVLDEINLQIDKNAAQMQAILKTGLDKSADQRKVVSEALGHILCRFFLSAEFALADSEDRGLMQFDLTKLAFALAAYRADHGAYPAKLADLSPKYVAQVPKDRFTDGDLHYSLQGDGYLLYSVGPNGQDDGGKGLADRKEGSEPWDDIAIRITKP